MRSGTTDGPDGGTKEPPETPSSQESSDSASAKSSWFGATTRALSVAADTTAIFLAFKAFFFLALGLAVAAALFAASSLYQYVRTGTRRNIALSIGLLSVVVIASLAAVYISYPTKAEPKSLFVVASHPSQHCYTYRHDDQSGNMRGFAYMCLPTESLATYRAWAICHNDSTRSDYRIDGNLTTPTHFSVADCDANSWPKTGGFDIQK